MPSVSRSQQRLMGQALSLKRGDVKFSDLNPDYRDQIKDLADGMTLKQLEDFAKTSHKGLPEIKENSTIASLSSINGMSAISSPENPGNQEDFVNQKPGSGDKLGLIPKKKNSFLSYFDFLQKSQKLRSSF